MRPSWSTIVALATAIVVSSSLAAAAAPTVDTGAIMLADGSTSMLVTTTDSDGGASLLVTTADMNGEPLLQVRQWLGTGSERVPALMLVLTMLLAIPPLALAGLLVGRRRRYVPETTIGRSRLFRRAPATPVQTTARTYISSWPTEAWVHIDGAPGSRWVIGRTFVRIGQEEDNDIRLASHSVHRYHAVIRRTTDGDVVINDLSGAKGAGVHVNGKRVEETRLKEGDVIDVGAIRLRFDARPV